MLNRTSFLEQMELKIKQAANSGDNLALFLLDINSFKQINDVYGHGAGDEALRYLTNQLGSVLNTKDQLGRLGGDEFVVLIPFQTIAELEQLINRIFQEIELPFIYGSDVLKLRISLGVAIFPNDGIEAKILLHNADQAMYQAEKSGGGFSFFHNP